MDTSVNLTISLLMSTVLVLVTFGEEEAAVECCVWRQASSADNNITDSPLSLTVASGVECLYVLLFLQMSFLNSILFFAVFVVSAIVIFLLRLYCSMFWIYMCAVFLEIYFRLV